MDASSASTGDYTGATRTQMIRNAAQLRLPSDNAAVQSSMNLQNGADGVNIGLGLPESAAEQITSPASTGVAADDANVDPQNTNPTRRATLDNPPSFIRLAPSDNMMDDD